MLSFVRAIYPGQRLPETFSFQHLKHLSPLLFQQYRFSHFNNTDFLISTIHIFLFQQCRFSYFNNIDFLISIIQVYNARLSLFITFINILISTIQVCNTRLSLFMEMGSVSFQNNLNLTWSSPRRRSVPRTKARWCSKREERWPPACRHPLLRVELFLIVSSQFIVVFKFQTADNCLDFFEFN